MYYIFQRIALKLILRYFKISGDKTLAGNPEDQTNLI